MTLPGALVLVGALAAAGVCCTSFSSSNDATPAAQEGGGAPGAPCWPNGSCPTSLACCLELDGGSRCADLASCGADHSHIECRSQADCAGGTHCCTNLATPPPDSGVTYLVLTNCLSRPCSGFSPERIVCTTNAECPSGKACVPLAGAKTFPDGKIFECE